MPLTVGMTTRRSSGVHSESTTGIWRFRVRSAFCHFLKNQPIFRSIPKHLRKATIIVNACCPSTDKEPCGFSWNFMYGIYTIICRHILILVKIWQNNRNFTSSFTYIYNISPLFVFIIKTVLSVRYKLTPKKRRSKYNNRGWSTVNLRVCGISIVNDFTSGVKMRRLCRVRRGNSHFSSFLANYSRVWNRQQ